MYVYIDVCIYYCIVCMYLCMCYVIKLKFIFILVYKLYATAMFCLYTFFHAKVVWKKLL